MRGVTGQPFFPFSTTPRFLLSVDVHCRTLVKDALYMHFKVLFIHMLFLRLLYPYVVLKSCLFTCVLAFILSATLVHYGKLHVDIYYILIFRYIYFLFISFPFLSSFLSSFYLFYRIILPFSCSCLNCSVVVEMGYWLFLIQPFI